MKCLIITTQYANNMGALLQCYALSTYINSLNNVKCEVIQYYPPNWELSWKIFGHKFNIESILRNFYIIFHPTRIIKAKLKNRRMTDFVRKYIPLTEFAYYGSNQLFDCPPEADAYVCGSDQIWNMNLKDLGGAPYFLEFVKGGKLKIAYAPSIAEEWNEKQRQKAQKWLKTFNNISVREIQHVNMLKSISGLDVRHVIDPVFLLDADKWDTIANEHHLGNYIFCYFISVSPMCINLVKKVKELTGLKVIYLNVNLRNKIPADRCIRIADPTDFVGLIKGASFICTNSFHCTAFSIIYKKNVKVTTDMRNSRMKSLETIFQLDNLMVDNQKISIMKEDDLIIDYSSAKSAEAHILSSKEYLKSSLNVQ